MARIPKGQFEVWVTHQVNITAVTDRSPGMGEAIVVDQRAMWRGRLAFD